MESRDMACCCLQELNSLEDYNGNSKVALKNLCDSSFTIARYEPSTYRISHREFHENAVYGHYVFTGVVGYTRGEKDENIHYGPKLLRYIRRHKLGKVVASVVAPNRVNHSSHLVQAYIWTPNPENLKKWYEKVTKPKAKKVKVPSGA